jgi:hypothetical protein
VLLATLLVLSVMVNVAVRLKGAVGEKVTLRVQLLPAATEPPQLLDWAKSPEFAPDSATLKVKVAFPVLLRVTVCAALDVPTFWLLKVRLVAETAAMGARAVPVRLTVCGLPAALSAILTEAVRVTEEKAAVGANVTLMVQLPPVIELPHVLVCAKSPELAPVMLTPMLLTVPVALRVMVCGGLVVPTL